MSKQKIRLDSIQEQHDPATLTNEEQRKLDNMLNQGQLHDYFRQMQSDRNLSVDNVQLAGIVYADEKIRNVSFDIKSGKVNFSQGQQNINRFLIHQKIDEEESKARELKMKRQQILRQLEYLESQTSRGVSHDKNPELYGDFRHPNVLSKQEHEVYITKLQKNREQLDNKHRKNLENLQKSIEEEREKLKKMKEEKMNKQRQKRKKKIQKSLEKKKQEHERLLQEHKQSQIKYQQIKKKKFRHQEIQERYQSEVLVPNLEEKKRKLKEIRQLSKNFNINEILQHEKEYIQKRNQSFSTVKSKVNEDWHYKPPKKTERLTQFLEDEKTEQRRKLEEEKRKIDQKISRKQNYINYLKEKFVPVVDPKKQKEIQNRIYRQKNRRRQSQTDSKILGMSYLEQSKRLAKKTVDRAQTDKHTTQRSDSTHKNKSQYTNYLVTIAHDREYYENKRRKRLQKLVNSQQSQSQKVRALQRESQKINMQLRRRNQLRKVSKVKQDKEQQQQLELLLSGIQAKMGIINIFKDSNKQ